MKDYLRVDLHTHTNRYSGCGQMDPEEVVETAISYGIDVLVFTDHDVQWSLSDIDDLQAYFLDILLLSGVEISCHEGHVIALGLPEYEAPDENLPIETVLRHIHSHDGLAILAHPFRWELSEQLYDYWSRLPFDAVEVCSANVAPGPMTEWATKLAREMNIPEVAGSDTHTYDMMGRHATLVSPPVRNMSDLIAAIRGGRCRAVCDCCQHTPWKNTREMDVLS